MFILANYESIGNDNQALLLHNLDYSFHYFSMFLPCFFSLKKTPNPPCPTILRSFCFTSSFLYELTWSSKVCPTQP